MTLALAHKPTPAKIHPPIHELRGALAHAGKKYGAPTSDYHRSNPALFFGKNDEVIIAWGGQGYKFELGEMPATYGLHELLSIHRDYMKAHGGKLRGVRPIDTIRWFAEKFAPQPIANACTTLLAPRDICRQRIMEYWLAQVLRPRASVTEDAPDRLSDDPNTPALPVLDECPLLTAAERAG